MRNLIGECQAVVHIAGFRYGDELVDSAGKRLKEAEPAFKRALSIHDKSFGPDRPEVARSLNNLAVFLWDAEAANGG